MGISSNGGGADVGDIKAHAKAAIPAGWLECGGQAVSRTTYAALFLAIGTFYGAGDGVTTFNLPDIRGRSLFGKDNLGGTAANRLTTGVGGVDGVSLGAVGGGQSVTLTTTTLPSHAHTDTGHNHSQNAHSHVNFGADSSVVNSSLRNVVESNHGGSSATTAVDSTQATTATNIAAAAAIAANGSSGAHANIPPALVTIFIIKA